MTQSRIIDLSYPIKSDMLVYPGTERPAFQWVGRVNSEGFNLTRMSMLVHTGTHVDAPAHFIENGASIDEIPLERLFGKAKLFRCQKEPRGQEITSHDLSAAGFELEDDMIFVLETGIEKFGETREYNELFPVPSDELLRYLIERKIKAYMTDATATDAVGAKRSSKHHILLGAGIPIVENLRNLHRLPENRPFLISALPIRLSGREGAPCRAMAVTDIQALIQG
jgi:arylformamidase